MSTTTSTRSRITYYAPDRTFVWLYKNQPFLEFINALRRKLVLPDDATINVKQIHNGNILDIDNEDEYEAFCDLARTTPAIDIRVTINDGPHAPDSSIQQQQLKANEGAGRPDFLPAVHSSFFSTKPHQLSIPLVRKRKNSIPGPELSSPAQKSTPRMRKKRKNDHEGVGGRGLSQSPSLASLRDTESSQNMGMIPRDSEPLSVFDTTGDFSSSSLPKITAESKLPDGTDIDPSLLSTPNLALRKSGKQKSKAQISNVSAVTPSHVRPPEGMPPSAGPKSSLISESPVVSSLSVPPKPPVNLKKRQRGAGEPGDALQRGKKTKTTGRTKKGTDPSADSASLLNFVPDVSSNTAGSALITGLDLVPTPPVLVESSVNPLHQQGGIENKESEEGNSEQPFSTQPPEVPPESAATGSSNPDHLAEHSASPKTVPGSTVGDSNANEASLSGDRPAAKSVASGKDGQEPKPSRPSSRLRPAAKSKNVAQESSVQEHKASEGSMTDRPNLSKSKKSPVVDERAAPSVDTTKEAIQATEVAEQELVAKEDVPGNKKAKRTRKTKSSLSTGPRVNIQDIIDQVLAKNKVAMTPVPESEEPSAEKSVADTPSNLVVGDKSHSSVGETSATEKPAQKSRAVPKSKPAREVPCPVCNQSPFHLQYQCPLVTGSPESLRRRITELKKKRPVPKVLIKELEGFLSRSATKMGGSSMECASSVQDSGSVPEPLAKSFSRVEGPMNGVPIRTRTVDSKDDNSSGNDDAQIVPNVVPLRDPDDDLDALLAGPKPPASQKQAVLEVTSESAEDEGEDVELEDEEVDTKKSRKMARYEQNRSSDEEVVDNDSESPATEPLTENQLAIQVLSSVLGTHHNESSSGQKKILTTAGFDDEVVPPTDDEDEDEQERLPKESQIPTPPEMNAAASMLSRPWIPDKPVSIKKHSRISELKATKSVLKNLKKRKVDGVDPIESSDDPPFQHPANSVKPLDVYNNDATVPTQSSPFLLKRMKDRLGVPISPTGSSALFPLLENGEETPAPHTSAMRPPPTPPWFSGEERSTSKNDFKPQGNKTQLMHSQNLSQRQSEEPSQGERSLIEWTTLPQTQSPFPIMSESSMIDELNSSPDNLSTPNVLTATIPPRHRKTSEVRGTPLFFPGTSQYPIPDSQLPDNNRQDEGVSSSSESNERAGIQPRRSRSFSSGAPYRRLTDIASQGSVFASPLLTSVAPSPPAKRDSKGNVFNSNRDESEDEEDSSSSDSGEEGKLHIPKSRRAGVKRGNKKGLFASL